MKRQPGGPLWARTALLLVPGIWLGLLIGISLIEAPLKFTAPGITVPLGLGIGQRVFLAMNIVEVVLALVLLLAVLKVLGTALRHRVWILSLSVLGVLAVKTLIIRPVLHQRTAAVLAGEYEGGSPAHWAYIAADGALLVLLSLLVLAAARTLLAPAAPRRTPEDAP
ncbi:MAG: hypothetical protein Q4F53_03420 [Nesterenkonia sp.]|nr:hypothetical protein [Nesterenkonia sp.]